MDEFKILIGVRQNKKQIHLPSHHTTYLGQGLSLIPHYSQKCMIIQIRTTVHSDFKNLH